MWRGRHIRTAGAVPSVHLSRDDREFYEPFHLKDLGGALSIIDPAIVGVPLGTTLSLAHLGWERTDAMNAGSAAAGG